MPIKRMVVMAASVLLLCATAVLLRGISRMPADQPFFDDAMVAVVPDRELSAEDIVELHVDVSMSDEAFQVLEALNKTFMERHADIKVFMKNHPRDTLYEHLHRAFRLGDAADIMLLDNEKVLQYAVLARLQPMDDYYTSESEAEYIPTLTEQLRWNGYTWGIPYQVQPYVVAFNKSAWFELTGDDQPAGIEQLMQAYQTGQLIFHPQDAKVYAVLAAALDADWQFAEQTGSGSEEDPKSSFDQINREDMTETENESTEGTEGAEADLLVPDEASDKTIDRALQGRSLSLMNRSERAGLAVLNSKWSDEDGREQTTAEMAGDINVVDEEEPAIGDSAGEAQAAEGEQAVPVVGSGLSIAVKSADEIWEKLASGEAAAAILPLHVYSGYASEEVSAVLLPSSRGDYVFISGQSFVLAADAADREAAYRWIREIIEGFELWFPERNAGGFPASLDAYRELTRQQRAQLELLMRAVEEGKALAPDPRIADKLAIVREVLSSQQAFMLSIDELAVLIEQRFADSGWVKN